MTFRRLRLATTLLSAIACACSSEGAPNVPASLDFAAFDAELDRVRVEQGLDGATVAIVHRDYGVVHTRGYGDFDADRVILLASASKMISAGVLARLADRGLLDLDAPISTYLSDWGVYKTDVTVAQLVSNSSGLVSLADDPIYAPYICQYLPIGSLDMCAATIYTADDAADRIPPDTAFHYGGAQWQLAGGIAEHVSGKSWAELVEETYTSPCDLGVLGYVNPFSESITLEEDPDLVYPESFMGDVANLRQTDNPSIEGGGYTTARDYGAILLMHLRGGRCGKHRVMSEEAVAHMQIDRIGEAYGGSPGDSDVPGYGLGWWVSRDRPGFVSNDGSYGAAAWIDGERGYGAVILVEDEFHSGDALREATQPMLEALFDAVVEE